MKPQPIGRCHALGNSHLLSSNKTHQRKSDFGVTAATSLDLVPSIGFTPAGSWGTIEALVCATCYQRGLAMAWSSLEVGISDVAYHLFWLGFHFSFAQWGRGSCATAQTSSDIVLAIVLTIQGSLRLRTIALPLLNFVDEVQKWQWQQRERPHNWQKRTLSRMTLVSRGRCGRKIAWLRRLAAMVAASSLRFWG